MTPYTHLTPDERAIIAPLRAQGASIAAIACQPGCARSTIVCELHRNATRTVIIIPTCRRTDV